MAQEVYRKDQGKGTATQSERIAELTAQRDELLTAAIAARDWLDRFGEHAPFVFGGEGKLDKVLRKAIRRAKLDDTLSMHYSSLERLEEKP